VDESGNVVLSLSVQADQPTVTANLYLKKGTYAVRFGGYTTDGSAWNDLNYQLSGGAFSDPVGSYPTSPNGSPSSPPLSSSPNNGPPPSTYTYNGSSSPPPPSSSQSIGAPMPYPSSSPYYY
jgi:hypothetical protein